MILLFHILGITFATTAVRSQTPSYDETASQKRILEEMSWPVKLYYYKEFGQSPEANAIPTPRKVAIQGLQLENRRQVTRLLANDDENMKMKLFRLMYETVRDTDMKVKRAELIKSHYANDSSFDIGYLIGDITDKFTIMNDLARTLGRYYNEWKPLEHINAYEQMSNQAVEINHIIDLIYAASRQYHNTTCGDDTATTSSSFFF